MMLRSPALALFGLTLSVCAAPAQDLPVRSDGPVLDLANVLDATTEARISRMLDETETTTGVQMKVVTMTSISDHGGSGERLDSYADRLLDAWQIGSPERNDGILIVVTTDPADARIALGSGYDPVYDKRAARVLADQVLPAFRDGRIPTGIEDGVVSVRDRLIAPFLTGEPVTVSEGFETAEPRLPPALLFLVLVASVVGLLVYRAIRSARLQKTCPSCGELTLTRTFEVIEAPASRSEGSGIEHRLCENCGHTGRQVYLLRNGLFGGYRRKLVK
jgi:uncharacterized protein